MSSTFALSNVKDAMKEIYANGPIEASFDVYEDFLSYKSGKDAYSFLLFDNHYVYAYSPRKRTIEKLVFK